MKRIGKILLGATVVAGLIGGGVWYAKQRAANDPEQRYKLATIEKGEVTQTVSANGTLNPVVLVSVGTQVSGTVKKLYVDFNDKVKQGQPLLELDDALVSAAERQSAANVASAQASLELAQANEARMKALFAQEYVSRQEYDQARQALKAGQAQLALARAQNDRDRANLNFTIIRSPVDGVVVDRVVDLGQTVAASFQTPMLIKIAQDLSEMRIDTSFRRGRHRPHPRGPEGALHGRRLPEQEFHRRRAADPPEPDQPAERRHLQRAYQRRQPGSRPAAGHDRLRQYRRRAARGRLAGAQWRAAFQAGGRGRQEGGKRPETRVDRDRRECRANHGPWHGCRDGWRRHGRQGPRRKKGKKRDGQSGTVYVLEGGEIKPVSVQLGITDNRNTEILGGELKAGDRVVTGENTAGNSKPSSVGMRMF